MSDLAPRRDGSAFDRVLHDVGSAIVRGDLPAGSIETVDGLVARTGASRSIVREATRVLGSLGMITAGRRVGLRVRTVADWDVLDPLVIRWRLDGPDRATQLDELRALRAAVEPEAARAAARAVRGAVDAEEVRAVVAEEGTRPDPVRAAELRGAVDELRAVADRLAGASDGADPAPFLQTDRTLHALVLQLSGNAVFRRLRAVVDAALAERRAIAPDPHDVALHVAVARAVLAGDPDAAAAAMREIVDRTT